MSTAEFEAHRGMLFGIAYRMLGSAADAEDIVQDAWLRWSEVTDPVHNPRAYLARTVTNLALNRLQSAAVQRETYVGPWLPEPLVTEPDAAEQVTMADSVSYALLVVLESLSPLERAVFVLREAFGFGYAEIAGMLGRTESAMRQVGHRARSHVQARQPRYETSAAERRKVTGEFLAASLSGDMAEMLRLLAPDVTVITDGGGKRQAALRPLHGADKFVRWLVGVMRKPNSPTFAHEVLVNGAPGIMMSMDGEPDSVLCAELENGRISVVHLIRNPDKLTRVTAPAHDSPAAPQPPT